MENGISELRVFEQDLQKDRHYILYGNGKKYDNEVGRMYFKYNYITIKMQLEIDKLKIELRGIKEENKRLIAQ